MVVYLFAATVTGLNAQETGIAPKLLLLLADEGAAPNSYTFHGGTLDDLLEVSPTLEFGDLIINNSQAFKCKFRYRAIHVWQRSAKDFLGMEYQRSWRK